MILPENIDKIIYPHKRLLIALSGGLDSTVLLHSFMLWCKDKPYIKLRAIHINHNLNIDANKWVMHCQSTCKKWNVPLHVESININNNGLGIECHARMLRYEIFKKNLFPEELLITAHHLDDQAETFLLALKRGSGPKGLSSMPILMEFNKIKILRPLLKETRLSIKFWAKKYNLSWIEDYSNYNDSYDRNFLRLHIIPALKNRWPNFNISVARSAELCAEQENLLNELLRDELKSIVTDKKALIIEPLVSVSKPYRAAILRRWLDMHGVKMPSRSKLDIIWREVARARKDASPCLYLNEYSIRRFSGKLWCITKYHISDELTIN